MDQTSGHLSDLEIEQYGATVPAPQPAKDRAGKDIDADRIETHLADCQACRERVLTSQRKRLGLFMDPPVNNPRHADGPGPTPDCPGEDALRNLAAGLASADEATRLTHHAAQCDHCGPLLRMYVEDFSDDLSADDQAVLSKLKSSSAGWQEKLAKRMVMESGAAGAKAEPARARKPFLWRWVVAPGALASVAVIVFVIWYSQRETPETVAKLLGQGYMEPRQVEMRIPYGKHAELHQLRSVDNRSFLDTSPSLRKAGDEIATKLSQHPNDPTWLLLSARLDLLDSNYKAALSALDKIEDETILNSPEMLQTRALALYEKAGLEPDFPAYGQAADLLGKALQKNPGDPVALFNQAIACERIRAYGCAVKDWEHLLKVEKDSAWSQEAQEHLKRIQEKKTLEH